MERMMYCCARCRVWTGDTSLLSSASVTCEESDLQTIDGAVRIEWKLSRRASAIELTRKVADRAAVSYQRTLTIDENSIRTIDVYCPSPFSMTVIVQVDVSDVTQQCFLFSHVSPAAEAEAHNDVPTPVLRLGDRLDMLSFLSALHGHFKLVPLTAEARDLLSHTHTTQESTRFVSSKRNMLKRRRTTSSMDFYGQENKTPVITPPKSHSDSTITTTWTEFYERLQFNVSHSLLCQLEGTAPLSASFPRQQEAFEFVDQVVVFRERVAQQRVSRVSLSKTSTSQLEKTKLEEPRVFCFEGANEGKRRFWVTTLSAFWSEYTGIPEGARHVYEIIREGVPCRLYFDLEFKKKLNPGVDGDVLVNRLLSLVQLQIYRLYRLRIDRDLDVVQLESSTSDKFSRHLTINFPDGELFADNIHAGAFVRQLIHEVIATHEEGMSPFLVHDNASDMDQRQLFIDIGVYTRNRMFRVLGSSKFRKTAILRPLADGVVTESGAALDRDLFLRSIICPRGARAKSDTKQRLLRCDDANSLKRYRGVTREGGGISGGLHQSMRSVESRASIYPALDAFIRSIATAGGTQGEISAVRLMYADTSPDSATVNENPIKIVYHMRQNRWCEHVGRAHKSNNVMFVVDVPRREYVQRCHDPQCRAIGYRSPARPLPVALVL